MRRCDILVFGDTHAPFTDWNRWREVLFFAMTMTPRRIIHVGDVADVYPLSRFPKSEIDMLGPRALRREWEGIGRILGGMRVHSREQPILLAGNHDDRFFKRIQEVPHLWEYLVKGGAQNPFQAACAEHGIAYKRSHLERGILFRHGAASGRFGGYATAGKVRDRSLVQGHTHGLGLIFTSTKLFALETGHLVNTKSKAFSYCDGLDDGLSKWRHGFGWIDTKGRPHLEAL